MSVLVTNAKSRIAYNIVRSLGEKGIRVYTGDFIKHPMSSYSKHSYGKIHYPSPFRQQNQFIETIIYAIKKLNLEVLIPVGEETYLISKYKEEFLKHIKLCIPDYNKILIAHNKDSWQQIAQANLIPTPKNYEIDELQQCDCCSEISFPLLIKPKQGGGAWGISQLNNLKELKNFIRQNEHIGRPMKRFFIQEKIVGDTICVAMLLCHGKCKAKVVYKQIRDFPFEGGQATLRISIENREAENSLIRLLEKLNWHGICQADFIVDKKTGTPLLIDINPRFWGSITQGIASGIDFPYLIYKMAIYGDVEPLMEFQKGVMTRWLGGELRTFFSALRYSDKKMKFIKEFIRPQGHALKYDDISLSDPLPFFIWMFDVFARAIRSRTTGAVSHDSLDGIWE